MKFYEQGREKGGFESGIRLAVQSILMSPRFLFRLEQQPTSLGNSAIRNANFRLAMKTSRRACRFPVGHRFRTRN
jgi:hypothetical protein